MKNMSSASMPAPKERNIYFSQQVTQESILNVARQILEINADDRKLRKIAKISGYKYKPQPIKIWIDSFGGQVYQCFGLLSIMEASATPIHTIVTGCAMSCGFMIAIHGHKRFALAKSTLLYHQVSSIALGKVAEMEERLVQSKKLQKDIEDMVVEKTKITRKRLLQSYKEKEDWYITADEAKTLGCVDEIITSL
jgi:ATP-dependent Clp protease protease subunit